MDNKIIDMHAHIAYAPIFSKTFLDEVVIDFKKSGIPQAYVDKLLAFVLSDENGDKLIQQMDDAGIDKTVLLCTDFDFKKNDTPYSIQQMHQLHLEQVERHKDRLIAFAGVSPFRDETAYEIVKEYIEKYHFHGMKLYPPIGFRLNNLNLIKYYELCDYYSLPVMIHTGPSISQFQQIENYEQDVCSLAKRYPNIKMILAHGAIKNHKVGIALAKENENVYLDISSFQSELEQKEQLIEKLQECFREVSRKILFGTDWPMYHFTSQQKHWVAELKGLNIMEPDMEEMLMYKNARCVLGL